MKSKLVEEEKIENNSTTQKDPHKNKKRQKREKNTDRYSMVFNG